MRTAIGLAVILTLLSVPQPSRGEFNPAAYEPATQAGLAKDPASHVGKKYQVTDPFQFCGSDFCVQVQKVKINTREYYCFNLGTFCMVRMYLKKDHPDAPVLQKLKKGDKVTVYGTFDSMGSGFNYIVADHIVAEPSR